jgi:methanogenic corrinoid protein MtbC1
MNSPSSSSRRLRAIVTPESIRFARELALTGNFDQGLALAREKAQYDLPLIDVLVAMYLPVLREVGDLWHFNAIAHQDQAVASRVCDHVLDHVLDDVRPSPKPPEVRHGTVIVAAPEGEEHTFAGRLAALALMAEGWSVVDLGADVRAADLEAACAALTDLRGIVVHAAATSILPSALQLIDVATHHGVGVLVGGRGFGERGRYGALLGAAAWGEHPGRTLGASLSTVAVSGVGPLTPARDASAEVSARAAAHAAAGSCPFTDRLPSDAVGPLEPVRFLTADLAAAVLVDSPEIMADAVAWYGHFLATRGCAGPVLAEALDAVCATMADVGECRDALAAARAVLA